jgi:MFS family permease
VIVLFFASAGASAAYLTVSEVFPLETRALAIAFFYAIGTAAGGISGPLLFSALVSTGKVPDTVLAFCVGAVLMIAGGITELILGVKAERRSLEDIARPLTAAGRSSDQPQGQLRTAS